MADRKDFHEGRQVGAKLESEFEDEKQPTSTWKSMRFAIIGSGIGGAATSHFLRQYFGDAVIIDVYEKDPEHIGGRLRNIKVGQEEYEAGGSIIHEENRYMAEFAKMCGLKSRGGGEEQKLYLYNGHNYVFEESMWKAVTASKLLWRYGLDVFSMRKWIQDFLEKFRRVYDLQQRDGVCFRTPVELLEALDPDFGAMVEQTIVECMREHGFGEYFIHEFAQSIMRVNYGQSVNLGAFCGAVSLAGMGAQLWDVEEGNCRVPQTLLQQSKARVLLGANVTKISGSKKKGQYFVHTEFQPKKKRITRYDAVFICCPLDSTKPIIKTKKIPGLAKGTSLKSFARPYQRVVATFVRGPRSIHGLVPSRKPSCDAPAMVLTTCKDADFRSFGSQTAKGPATSNSESSVPCWKIFTGQPVTSEQLQRWFPEGHEHLAEKDWNAYPNYETAKNRSKMAPFCLDDNNLYYVNAIEGCASAMEMSCIGAHNCVLMAVKNFTGDLLKSLRSKL